MKWPLAVSSFTVLDRLKIGAWLLRENHWSQGDFVRAHEKTWEDYTGAPHAIMVSSGSAANHLLAFRRKWELERARKWPKKNKVLFPAVNWISAVSPWIQLGFKPVFMDVTSNLCSSGDQVAAALDKNRDMAAVFYTTLLGLDGDLPRIRRICEERGVQLYLDNCESSFTRTAKNEYTSDGLTHVCNVAPCSTSFYFSHHTSGNQEGGMIFCQTKAESDFYRMARNHGMTRGMPEIYKNPDANPHFDFYLLGSNHRSTNLIAYMASLDFERALAFAPRRVEMAKEFSAALDTKKYERPHGILHGGVPLALPILCREPENLPRVKKLLNNLGVENRPIVGGNLLRHTAFKKFGRASRFPRANHIHDSGVYIGLHPKVTLPMVWDLAAELNRL